ncbi:MAG: YggS family pyridoxal phosphate-dependent enzyme [Bdellovibrionota bacterium]
MELPSFNLKVQSATSQRWIELHKRVQNAVEKYNKTQSITIVASTRGLMADPVLEACEAGVSEFAEDYLPEGITKKPVIRHRFPLSTWHFTGILQPGKLHLAVEAFEWIHMFDRATLLKPLAEACEKHAGKKTKILIEVNSVGHTKKHGALMKDVPHLCDEISKIPNLELMGLSCKSELMMNTSATSKSYEDLSQLHQKLLKDGTLPSSATTLAMGTSRDIKRAIELGSTMLRIGSALFGKKRAFQITSTCR